MSQKDYRVSKSSVANAKTEEQVWKATDQANDVFIDLPSGERAKFLKKLTAGQGAVLAVGVLNGEVLNGGFGQFFSNSSCDVTKEALEGLELFGAKKHAALLRKAIQGGKLTESDFQNESERSKKLENPECEALFDELDTQYFALDEQPAEQLDHYIQAYYQSHPDEFHK